MNISISCCLTSLIIVMAAFVLSLVGMFYKQATCLLVDSVLMLISVFFFLLSLSLHWAHRHQRTASLTGSSHGLVISQPGWSQYLGELTNIRPHSLSYSVFTGAGGIITALLASLSLHSLSRLLITMLSTGPVSRLK